MTAEIIVPGNKPCVLNRPEMEADLIDATNRRFIAWTAYETHGFFRMYETDIPKFKTLETNNDKNIFAHTKGTLIEAGTVIQLQGGSFIHAT